MSFKVSFIMSVFNGEEWIDQAIKNILEQQFINYEILIVNDGSTDSSEEIILSHLKFNKNIKYLPKRHSGLTDSLNYGLKKSSGKWIARIDVDDTSDKNRLIKQLKLVERNKNIVLCGSNFQIRKKNKIVFKSNLPEENNKLLYRLKNMKAFFPHSSALFLRDRAIQVGGYRKAFRKSQDHDLWLRLSEIGEISCCKEFLVEINEHSNRISNSKLGWPQHIYAITSIISHYLRINNYKYLENKIRNMNIDDFLYKVHKFLEKNNFYKVQSFKKEFKNLLKQRNKILMVKFLLIHCLSNRYYLFLALMEMFFGINLPYKFYLDFKKGN